MDGTPGVGGRGTAGLGIVVRGPGGRVWFWRSARVPAATSNEAEYQAVIAGLMLVAERHPSATLCCLNDNRIVIDQLAGRCAVRAPLLLPLHARALALAHQFAAVEFRCIPRELNRLADALAWEALSGHNDLLRALRSD